MVIDQITDGITATGDLLNGMNSSDWRTLLKPYAREKIVNKVLETLKSQYLGLNFKDLHHLKEIAMTFENVIYNTATSQRDYVEIISMKLMKLEDKSQSTGATNSLPSKSAGSNQNPLDPASNSMQSQVQNQGKSLSISLVKQSQAQQPLLSQCVQNPTAFAGVQSSASFPSVPPLSVTGLTQTTMPNVVNHSSNLQNMSGFSQNMVVNSVEQGALSYIFSNSQRQMQGKQHPQHVVPQQLSQNQQQYMYQQRQSQHQILKQNIHQRNIQPSFVQSTPTLLQQDELVGQQQQFQQSVNQCTPVFHQRQAAIHQQQLMGEQPNASSLQHTQPLGQQSSSPNMQQHQQQKQQQKLLGQHCNPSNMQQQQQPLQGQQSNISYLNQQQWGSRTNVFEPQKQQEFVRFRSGILRMESHQHSMHILQQANAAAAQQQQTQQASFTLPTKGKQQQLLPSEHRLMFEPQSPPSQLHQDLGSQQQPNSLERDWPKSSATEQPLERLMNVVKAMSPKAFRASISDIVAISKRVIGSESRDSVSDYLMDRINYRLQPRNFILQDGSAAIKKMRRFTSAMPLDPMPSSGRLNDSFKQLNSFEISDLESTAMSRIKRPKLEPNHALSEEMRDINQRLIDTVVDKVVDSTESAAVAEDGVIVKCSFHASTLNPNLKSHYASAQMFSIMPLRLLVPPDYPNCSPVLLDKLPLMSDSKEEYEDLLVKARLRLSKSLRILPPPMSLGDMAKTWDSCARAVVDEYAQQSGGGTFSSRYGTWEKCMAA